METTTMVNLDPTSISAIKGLRCRKYLLIGAQWKFESPSIELSILAGVGLEGFGCTTWGALVLVTICGPTHGSNVISLMSSIIILGGLSSGSPCMFKVFISVCCVFSFRMMIQANSVWATWGNISIEPIDCMGMCSFGMVEACKT
jgi:hypothetical protein